MQLLGTNFAIDGVLVTHDGTSKREFIDRTAFGADLYSFHSIALLHMFKPLPAKPGQSAHTSQRRVTREFDRTKQIWLLNFMNFLQARIFWIFWLTAASTWDAKPIQAALLTLPFSQDPWCLFGFVVCVPIRQDDIHQPSQMFWKPDCCHHSL